MENPAVHFAKTLVNPPVSPALLLTVKQRFGLRVVSWLLGYGLLFCVWGVYNAWPVELWVSLACFFLNVALAGWLYRTCHFGLETPERVSEWEALISFLLLAIGVASGLLLLMALGWISVGAVYLRPAKPNISWEEWFKLPFLFLFSLPFWLDLIGSRYDWVALLSDNPGEVLPRLGANLGWLHWLLIIQLSLMIMMAAVRGVVFWLSLPCLLFWLAINQVLARWLAETHPNLAELLRWHLEILGVIGLAWLGHKRSKSPLPAWLQSIFTSGLSRERSYSLLLASVVIMLQQSALVEGYLADSPRRLALLEAILLGLAWLWLRYRGAAGAVHGYSLSLLAFSLGILLAAEWTDVNALRHLALGGLLICLASWRRAWPLRSLALALATWLMVLPSATQWLTSAGFPAAKAELIRPVLFWLGLAAFVLVSFRHRYYPEAVPVSDAAWKPTRRLVQIFLGLLLLFQTISAFWREASGSLPDRPSIAADIVVESETPIQALNRNMADSRQWRLQWQNQPVTWTVARPVFSPSRLEAPERALRAVGWQVVQRRIVAHPRGQAVVLQLKRREQRGSAMYWFEQGESAFVHYLRARSVLWSGWNLSRRDLRRVMLLSETVPDPAPLRALVQTARRGAPRPDVKD